MPERPTAAAPIPLAPTGSNTGTHHGKPLFPIQSWACTHRGWKALGSSEDVAPLGPELVMELTSLRARYAFPVLVATDHGRPTLEIRPYRPADLLPVDPREELRGSVLRFNDPFAPAAEGGW